MAGLIAVITGIHYALQSRRHLSHVRHTSNAVLAFWLAYILPRPLGASIGDYLSPAKKDGGLGLGLVVTSAIFLSAILALLVFLSVTRRDEIHDEEDAALSDAASSARIA